MAIVSFEIVSKPFINWLGQGSEQKGFPLAMAVFATLSFFMFIACFFLTKERVVPAVDKKSDLFEDLKILFANDQWLIVAILNFIFLMPIIIRGAGALYYLKWYAGRADLQNWFLGIGMTSAMFGAGFASPLTKRLSKVASYMLVQAIAVAVSIAFFFVRSNQLVLMFVLFVIVQFFTAVGTPILWAMMADTKIEGLIPQVGLNIVGGGKEHGIGGEEEFADGRNDENIEVFCQILKSLNRPVFVRIGYEFEGDWNGYKPDTYKAAFIRITKAMRKHRLNAATVWCSAGGSAGNVPHSRVMQYYPGDEWVDWWGVDIFSPGEILSSKVKKFCDDAAKHEKPIMIGEATARFVGVLNGKYSWDEWFEPFFKLIRQTPQIKSFCYINWEWAYWSDKLGFPWHNWGDCRIEKNEYITRMYKEEMDSPLYEHLK